MTRQHEGQRQEAKHVASMLMRQSLVDREVVRSTERPVIRILPWLNVVKIGGHSIIDKGREAVFPVVEDLSRALEKHKLLIATGAGVRSRHIFTIGLDLGLPTGVLSALSAADAEQNGHILGALLAKHGVVFLPHAMVAHQLAIFLTTCNGVVMNGVPPYDLWEFPPEVGKIPAHRTDAGTFLLADAYGARQLIYVEDVDGIFTDDPKTDPTAELIRKISADDLAAMNLRTLPVDRLVLDLLHSARHVREFQIVNGRQPGNILRALEGQHVGTIVHA